MSRRVRESRARFIHEPLQSKSKFDPRSFRTKVSRAHRITFGCPKGKYSPSTELCKVPVQIQKILHPMKEAMLANPCPISKNPIPKLGTGYDKKKFTVEDYDIITERLARITPGKKIRYGGKEWKIGPETFDLYYKSFGPLVHRGWTKFSLEGIRRKSSPGRVRHISWEGLEKRKNPRRDITIEKEATMLFSKGVGIGSVVETLKRKYNLSTDMARYFARRAGAVTRGARKYVAPEVERAVYPVMLNPKEKLYVGVLAGGYAKLFRSLKTPTKRSHGRLCKYAIGPFRTRGEAITVIHEQGLRLR